MRSPFQFARKYVQTRGMEKPIPYPSGFLSRGRKWLAQKRVRCDGVNVTYVHKGKEYRNIPATVNRTSFRLTGTEGWTRRKFAVKLREELHDFVFTTESLPFLSATERPIVGDYIVMRGVRYNCVNTASYHYTGTETAGSAYSFADPSMHTIRVHTILYK